MAVTVSVLANIVGVVGLVVIVIKLVQKVLSHRKWVAVYDALPGESHKKHWLWGHVHLYPGPNEEGLKFQMERVSRFPKLHCLWISFIRPIIVMHHPDTMRAILKTSEPKPRGLGTVYIMGVDWLGEGLLIANGERWARNRRLLTPAFHFDILQPYIKVYNRATDVLLEKIEDRSKANKSFELFSNIGLCSLDIILRCAFSYESNCQTLGESHPYVCAVEKLSEIWVDRSLNPVLFPDFIFYLTKTGKEFRKACDYVHTVAEEIIEKRRKTLEVEGLPNKDTGKRTRYLDFLDILITAKDENGEGLTPLEIRNEVDTFLFEGHDTTTSSMCWTLYSISQHPKWQTKIQEEIDHLLKAKKSSEIESEDLPKLESLTLCIKEGMRLHCPVGFISRVTTKEMIIDGITIPANTTLALQIYNLHHNDTVWENPHEFMPERFLPENSADRDSYAFIPFSAGPRNCIGQHFAMNEQKVVLARLLQKFTFQPDPDCLVKKKIGVVMRAENGIKLLAHPRS
ncbi:cytochrome P450 4F6-like isoform X1 [Mytilus galloprovincialis]|uniref:cytochrome P450 4F6-like isoform X1 n=1 Tax=Mytilus galloprovincialis TaxID=29158 RepID=UPI003F7C2932